MRTVVFIHRVVIIVPSDACPKGPFTQAIFVAQLNAIYVALSCNQLRFHRDFSAVCQCKMSVHVYFVNKSCVPAQK